MAPTKERTPQEEKSENQNMDFDTANSTTVLDSKSSTVAPEQTLRRNEPDSQNVHKAHSTIRNTYVFKGRTYKVIEFTVTASPQQFTPPTERKQSLLVKLMDSTTATTTTDSKVSTSFEKTKSTQDSLKVTELDKSETGIDDYHHQPVNDQPASKYHGHVDENEFGIHHNNGKNHNYEQFQELDKLDSKGESEIITTSTDNSSKWDAISDIIPANTNTTNAKPTTATMTTKTEKITKFIPNINITATTVTVRERDSNTEENEQSPGENDNGVSLDQRDSEHTIKTPVRESTHKSVLSQSTVTVSSVINAQSPHTEQGLHRDSSHNNQHSVTTVTQENNYQGNENNKKWSVSGSSQSTSSTAINGRPTKNAVLGFTKTVSSNDKWDSHHEITVDIDDIIDNNNEDKNSGNPGFTDSVVNVENTERGLDTTTTPSAVSDLHKVVMGNNDKNTLKSYQITHAQFSITMMPAPTLEGADSNKVLNSTIHSSSLAPTLLPPGGADWITNKKEDKTDKKLTTDKNPLSQMLAVTSETTKARTTQVVPSRKITDRVDIFVNDKSSSTVDKINVPLLPTVKDEIAFTAHSIDSNKDTKNAAETTNKPSGWGINYSSKSDQSKTAFPTYTVSNTVQGGVRNDTQETAVSKSDVKEVLKDRQFLTTYSNQRGRGHDGYSNNDYELHENEQTVTRTPNHSLNNNNNNSGETQTDGSLGAGVVNEKGVKLTSVRPTSPIMDSISVTDKNTANVSHSNETNDLNTESPITIKDTAKISGQNTGLPIITPTTKGLQNDTFGIKLKERTLSSTTSTPNNLTPSAHSKVPTHFVYKTYRVVSNDGNSQEGKSMPYSFNTLPSSINNQNTSTSSPSGKGQVNWGHTKLPSEQDSKRNNHTKRRKENRTGKVADKNSTFQVTTTQLLHRAAHDRDDSHVHKSIPSTSNIGMTTMNSIAIGNSTIATGFETGPAIGIIIACVIAFWIILGPLICIICRLKDKAKARRSMSQEDEMGTRLVEEMVRMELARGRDKKYQTSVSDMNEIKPLRILTMENEYENVQTLRGNSEKTAIIGNDCLKGSDQNLPIAKETHLHDTLYQHRADCLPYIIDKNSMYVPCNPDENNISSNIFNQDFRYIDASTPASLNDKVRQKFTFNGTPTSLKDMSKKVFNFTSSSPISIKEKVFNFAGSPTSIKDMAKQAFNFTGYTSCASIDSGIEKTANSILHDLSNLSMGESEEVVNNEDKCSAVDWNSQKVNNEFDGSSFEQDSQQSSPILSSGSSLSKMYMRFHGENESAGSLTNDSESDSDFSCEGHLDKKCCEAIIHKNIGEKRRLQLKKINGCCRVPPTKKRSGLKCIDTSKYLICNNHIGSLEKGAVYKELNECRCEFRRVALDNDEDPSGDDCTRCGNRRYSFTVSSSPSNTPGATPNKRVKKLKSKSEYCRLYQDTSV